MYTSSTPPPPLNILSGHHSDCGCTGLRKYLIYTQGPVVQRLDNAIQPVIAIRWISVNKTHYAIHWIVFNLVDSIIHLWTTGAWMLLCGSIKYLYPLNGRSLNILRGGGSQMQNFWRKVWSYFQMDRMWWGESNQKTFHGRSGIFSGTKH